MDEDDAFFEMEPEGEELQQIKMISDSNPNYEPRKTSKADRVSLKMVEIPKQEFVSHYVPFKLSKNQQENANDETQKFGFNSPFTQFYDKQQLVYQRFPNQLFNKHNDISYFSGVFIQKNLFTSFLKDDSISIDPILTEFYEITNSVQVQKGEEILRFDSNFQSGNLFSAFKIGRFQYDLVMQNDINSRGNNQWFYFAVEGMIQNQDYTFNVINFTKSDSLFNYGMAPAIFSVQGNLKKKEEWNRKGKEISYQKCQIQRQNSNRSYYKLSFTLSAKYQKDKLYIAHSYPYTFQKLDNFINQIVNNNKQIATKITIGKTIGKKPIPALIITQPQVKKRQHKKAVIIMARQHPGETQGSFVCEGTIKKILQRSKEGDFLRKYYAFYIIPMVNIDGVIFGHYRTNLIGKDLNRKWDSVDKEGICPEVICIKQFLMEISKTRDIRFILDLHGHSKKFNSFFYGNPCPQNPDLVRIYPYICSRANPAIEFMDCSFAHEEYKKKAARIYLSTYFRQIQVYTFEASFYGFINANGKKEEFTPKLYSSLGQTLVQVLYLLFENEVKVTQAAEFNLSKNSSAIKEINVKGLLVNKYWKELKENKQLLGIGSNFESGSQSKPEEGQIDINTIAKGSQKQQNAKKFKQEEEFVSKKSVRFSTRKSNRQIKVAKQIIKPLRNKVLILSQVNAVLPDKYHMGLQPIKRREIQNFCVFEVASQTDPTDYLEYPHFSSHEIKARMNLILQTKINHSRRHSQLISSINNSHGIMNKFSLTNQCESEKVQHLRPRYNSTGTQTLICFLLKDLSPQKSIKKFKAIDSKYQEYISKINDIKMYDFDVKVKTKKYITLEPSPMEKELTISTPPLNIHKKEIYRK